MLKKLLEWESLRNETILTTKQKLCLCVVEIIICILDVLLVCLGSKILGIPKFWDISYYFGIFIFVLFSLITRISKVLSKGTK